MASEQGGDQLAVPPVERARYSTNFIRLAVCELRFPTLFELDAPRPPARLSRALRKEYPTVDLLTDVSVAPGGLAQAPAHAFRSRKKRWTITLRPSALTLETAHYESFDEFVARLAFVIDAARDTFDSEFFTRVGLRYINSLPYERGTIMDWVNRQLVTPLGEGVFGDVVEHWQAVRGNSGEGGYSFRHGLGTNRENGRLEYVLDYDFYQEDVDVEQAVQVVRRLHALEFSLFQWSLGPKAKEHLGPSLIQG